MEDGTEGAIQGWMVIRKGVELIKGAQNVIGMTQDDVCWQGLGKRSETKGKAIFWSCVGVLGLIDGILLIPITILITVPSPELMQYLNPFCPIQNKGEILFQLGEGVKNQLANSLSSISTFFLSLLSLLALVVPAIVIGQPRCWYAIKAALNSTQTPCQHVKSLWPEDMDALVFGSVGLVFLPIAPLMNIQSLYHCSSQSGGQMELTMVSMFALAPSLQSTLLGLILLSHNQYMLTSIAYIILLAILGTSIGLLARDCRKKRQQRLDPHSRLALDVFEHGPNWEKKHSISKDSKKSWTDLIDCLLSPLESHLSVTHLVPLPSEVLDDVLDTKLALHTYPDVPPYLSDLPWKVRSKVGLGGEILCPPILLQGALAVMLPKDGVASEEAKEMMKYWDLEAFYEEGMTTKDLNFCKHLNENK
ncbi:hypothetical protein CROQUDRAFT_129498 [Cronartium quercuum f. sp. fusiforme G11]|uniref:Uncharacterized protein n=1 Tax=Cronartium quercuum f. sp. fusiforme G11 TaxID=708437 RepID=A0A9P6TJ88_9BASI|nr:hypothetical protein CROQUDRAFT_129498 [Cronartium quercuum f. sp. fusiforme G11]